jgi:hypothetical protein
MPTHTPSAATTVATARDEIAALLTTTCDPLTWAVRLCLAEAFNYLDDALPHQQPPRHHTSNRGTPRSSLGSSPGGSPAELIRRLRADLLTLTCGAPDALPEGVDPYAVGHAAGQLNDALRELATVRPA